MQWITRKHLARRTVLRGAGIALGLPLIDAMIPAQTPASAPVKRLGFLYLAHGFVMDQFTPAGDTLTGELPRILKPFAPHRDRITILSGLDHKNGVLAGAGHPGASSTWLSGGRCKKTEGEDVSCGTTIDQMAAERIGQATVVPSLELATEDASGMVGACDVGFSCTYVNTISWRGPKSPNPMETNPRVVFDRLVGQGATQQERMARMQEDRSILDSLSTELAKLRGQLGSNDRRSIDDYLQQVREIERRIQLAEKRAAAVEDVPATPAGTPEDYETHIRLMLDLQLLAYRADLTRVSTFVQARELNQRAYPQLGVPDSHHSLSHHQNDAGKIEKLIKIQTYHAGLWSEYLSKLKATPDGDGTLLDHTLLMMGSGMSNSNLHSKSNLPTILAGAIRGGRHLKNPEGTPMANLLRGVLDRVGVHVDQIADSSNVVSL